MRPAFVGLLVQLGAAAIAVAAVRLLACPPWWWLPLQVALALGLCAVLRQPLWWYPIHALFAPAIFLFVNLAIPPWVFLAALVISWLVFGRIDRSRVPLYLSNRAALQALDNLVPAEANVLDLGAGTATVLVWLARRGHRRVTGVEHAWLPWLIGRCRCALTSYLPPPKLLRGDMMSWPLQDYDVVYAFLSPAAMPALWDKAKREMRAGSVLISNSFAIPGVPATEIVELNDWKGARLYLWRM